MDTNITTTVGRLHQFNDEEYEVWDEASQQWCDINQSSYFHSGSFPDPVIADTPVNVIGCYDSLTKKYWVFGVGAYDRYTVKDYCKDIDPLDIEYINCKDEIDLFKKFTRWWRKDFPDVIVSWNGFSFDLPYIINRFNKLFGADKAKCLSPFDYITFKEVTNAKYGNTYIEYTLKGITHLDYMVLYKTLKPEKNLDSFTLDFVAKEELNDVSKIDLEGLSLYELFKKRFNKFISYNIQDVNVMRLLDEKLKLIELTRFLCTMGFSNFDKVYGKVSFIAGMFARRSLEKGKYMLTKRPEKNSQKIPGGHVKEPSIGLWEHVVYFDANSLYPNTIISLNISPETKRGKVTGNGDSFDVVYKNDLFNMNREDLNKFLINKNLILAGSGDLFTKDFMGVLPEFCDFLYKKRVEHKDLMLQYEAESTKYEKHSVNYSNAKQQEGTQYIIQNVYKTVMNSCYGVLLNVYFPLYDRDCGMAVTLSGQKIIKKTFEILNDFLQRETGIDKDFVVCGDTDSVAVELKDFLKKRNLNIYKEDGFINETFRDVENELSDVLNTKICQWVRKQMYSDDVRYKFKRETVCRNALYIAKKNYILNVVNKEGVDQKKFTVKGHLSKAICSKPIKKIGTDLAKGIMLSGWTESDAIHYYQQVVMNELSKMSVPDLAIRKNIKDYEKYAKVSNGLKFAKGTPNQHKGAIAFNYLIDHFGLQNKYAKVMNGTKVQLVQVKPNKFGIELIGYINEFPPEFGLEMDIEKTADKSLIYYIKPLYACLNWSIPDINNLYSFNLNDLF